MERSDVKEFIRKHTLKVNETMRSLQKGRKRKAEKVTYRFREVSPCGQRFTYDETRNGTVIGSIIVAEGSNGKPRIVQSFYRTPQSA